MKARIDVFLRKVDTFICRREDYGGIVLILREG